MAKLNIVLVEPQIPQNTGNIARTCAATGAALHLVGKLGFEIDNKKLKRAGLDYWEHLDISYYESFEDFYSKHPENLFYFTTKAEHTHSDASYPDNSFLIFGREDAGLPEELLLKNRENSVRIPMQGEIRSLNLSNTVAIAVYEVLRQWDYPELINKGSLTKYKWE